MLIFHQNKALQHIFLSRKNLSNAFSLGSWGEGNKMIIKTEYGNPPSWEQLEDGRLIGRSLCCSICSPGIKKKIGGCGRGHKAEEPQSLLFAEAVQGRNACYPKVCPGRQGYAEGWSGTHSSQDPPFSTSFWLCPCPWSLANQCWLGSTLRGAQWGILWLGRMNVNKKWEGKYRQIKNNWGESELRVFVDDSTLGSAGPLCLVFCWHEYLMGIITDDNSDRKDCQVWMQIEI